MELTLLLPPLLDGLTLPMLESAPMFMDNRLLAKHVSEQQTRKTPPTDTSNTIKPNMFDLLNNKNSFLLNSLLRICTNSPKNVKKTRNQIGLAKLTEACLGW